MIASQLIKKKYQLNVGTNEILQDVVIMASNILLFNFETRCQVWDFSTSSLISEETNNPKIF